MNSFQAGGDEPCAGFLPLRVFISFDNPNINKDSLLFSTPKHFLELLPEIINFLSPVSSIMTMV